MRPTQQQIEEFEAQLPEETPQVEEACAVALATLPEHARGYVMGKLVSRTFGGVMGLRFAELCAETAERVRAENPGNRN
jgi:hypothetical protein